MDYRRSTKQSNGTCPGTELKKGSLLRVKGNRAGQTIRCLNGKVWITQEGDNKDRVLNGGEMYLSNLSSFVLVGALDDAEVKICPESKERFFGGSPQIWQGALTKA